MQHRPMSKEGAITQKNKLNNMNNNNNTEGVFDASLHRPLFANKTCHCLNLNRGDQLRSSSPAHVKGTFVFEGKRTDLCLLHDCLRGENEQTFVFYMMMMFVEETINLHVLQDNVRRGNEKTANGSRPPLLQFQLPAPLIPHPHHPLIVPGEGRVVIFSDPVLD